MAYANAPTLKPSNSMSRRVSRLKEEMLGREGEFHEWFSLWSESMAIDENEPVIVRRAKAFAHLLDHMPLELPAGALIVGRPKKSVLGREQQARLYADWIKFTNPPNEDQTIHYQEEGLFRAALPVLHLAPDLKQVLQIGLGGLQETIQQRMARERDELARNFLQAALVCIAAVSRFALRHAQLVKEAVRKEDDALRILELEELVRICTLIAYDPPDSFWAALQLVWFIYLLLNLEAFNHLNVCGPGCLDRWLIQYFRRDLEAGALTQDRALELLECFFVEMNASLPRTGILPFAIGGIGEGKRGMENELTLLFLQAISELKLLHPSFALRYHKGIPRELLRAALRFIGTGSSYPALFNDDVCIPSLQLSGVSEEDAREWIHSACTELTAVGVTNANIAAPYFNLAKCLELTLNHGRCLLTGQQLGEDLGSLSTFRSFEELYSAFCKQMSIIMGKSRQAMRHLEWLVKEKSPYPFLSCFTHDCLEKGRDFTDGGARHNPDYIQGTGIATTADSLAAIKYFVFDQKTISPEALLAALAANFVGHEATRQQLLNKAPKYGNDDDYPDGIFLRLVQDFYREVADRPNGRGGVCCPGFMTFESHNILGKGTGASTDGRLARTVLSDSVGAVQGRDRRGLTALFKSVTKTDYLPSVGGVTFNVKVSPEFFRSEEMLDRLEAAIRTYFEEGGMQMQINVHSREMLEEARTHPELHTNLLVRVGGFSAYFVELGSDLQEEIITRTMHQ